MSGRGAVAAGGTCLLLGALGGCLPNDTRTPPGSVLVTATADSDVADGIPASSTRDGWSISFDKALVALGNVSLDGDGCNTYSDANYNRIFDLKSAGAQKVSILYALGPCEFSFRVTSPNADTLLSAGATEADRTLMRTPGSDAFTDNAGVSMYVRGSAERAGVTKTFEWPFRYRARYGHCEGDAAGSKAGVDLREKAATTIDIRLRPSVLFEDDLDPSQARARFQVFADADDIHGNGDGIVALDELARVSLTASGFRDITADGGLVGFDAGLVHVGELTNDAGEPELSLADYLYLVLFPAIAHFEGNGSCSVRLSTRPGFG